MISVLIGIIVGELLRVSITLPQGVKDPAPEELAKCLTETVTLRQTVHDLQLRLAKSQAGETGG